LDSNEALRASLRHFQYAIRFIGRVKTKGRRGALEHLHRIPIGEELDYYLRDRVKDGNAIHYVLCGHVHESRGNSATELSPTAFSALLQS
jgi:hypothetical protein